MGFTYYDSDAIQQHDQESLQHYGVLGMKWGQRRFQNKDGSLTAAGKKHYEKTGEYGYQYKSHATKKYQRKAARAKTRAKIYRESIKEVKAKNDHNDFHEKSNNKFASKWEAKAKKYDAKASKYENRAKRSAEVDRGEQEYAKNLSTGKAIALTMLAGGNSMKGYAQYRAMAGQKGKNFTGQKAMAGIKAYNAGAYGSRLAKAAYIRQDEKKKTVGKSLAATNKKVSDIGANIVDNLTKPVSDAYRRNKKKR